MSTDFYFVCDKCKEGIQIAQQSIGGFSFYSGCLECMEQFRLFLESHLYHDIRLVTENIFYDLEDQGYKEIEWR